MGINPRTFHLEIRPETGLWACQGRGFMGSQSRHRDSITLSSFLSIPPPPYQDCALNQCSRYAQSWYEGGDGLIIGIDKSLSPITVALWFVVRPPRTGKHYPPPPPAILTTRTCLAVESPLIGPKNSPFYRFPSSLGAKWPFFDNLSISKQIWVQNGPFSIKWQGGPHENAFFSHSTDQNR